jgi:hypothetical protein
LTYPNKKYITTVTVKVKLKIFPQNWLYWEGFRSFFALNCVCYACLAPLLWCLFGEYWFRLSCYVCGGNRSFTPILRQSRWSLLYDVYWLVTMMVIDQVQQRVLERVARVEPVTGSKYMEHSPGSELFFSLLNKK